MSTAKAEYVSLTTCCAEFIWMRTQMLDYGFRYNKILMYCDSKSAIAISCNSVQHSRTKHINIRYHFIKEHVEKCTIELYFGGTEYQLVDLFTKAFLRERFEYLVHMIATDVPAVYLQHFWKTIHKVPDKEDTIIFKLDNQEIIYIVDMFRNTLQLPVETLGNPFVVSPTIEIIEFFMTRVGYQGVVEKDYHSIKDDIPLVSVYTTGNVTVRGMMISDAFVTVEIRVTDDYKEYETVFGNVVVLMNQSQPVVSTQGTHRSTPRAHRTPTLTTASPQGKKKSEMLEKLVHHKNTKNNYQTEAGG
uniref:Retrovirus-related Pol polyprotein from transposon TNT 1-94 n=1 Tax=Tanacetum cinerariifolium TaxID=118510 RepID=A0A6L2JU65_TANCI|nr:retrovirus-related Pol polyprotein from transposon TNT 1-94 [Tanacetum cinerariifolium]